MSEFERLHGIPLGRRGSQNDEEAVVLRYFGNRFGRLLDCGAFDGVTISNSLALIERGWEAVLVEPDPVALDALLRTHGDNNRVSIVAAAVSDTDGVIPFHSSHGGGVSTTRAGEKSRWSAARFTTIDVPSVTVPTLLKMNPPPFQFLSIDVEGESVNLFEKFDLSQMGVELAVVEHDGMQKRVLAHGARHGLHRLLRENPENLVIAK
jgi:FkbM family methyltransferase